MWFSHSRKRRFVISLCLLVAVALMTGCNAGGTAPQTTTPAGQTTNPIPPTSTAATPSTTRSSSSATTPSASTAQETLVSGVVDSPSSYDGKTVTLSGQTYLAGSPPKVLVGSTGGVNLVGNVGSLGKGFYRLTGKYDASSNTLNVTDNVPEQVTFQSIETGQTLGDSRYPVSLQGLIATPPKEVANTLSAYLSIPFAPKNLPIYPYVVYAKSGLYLVLSDTLIDLPAKFTVAYQGKDYSFTFCAGQVAGTLVKTPQEKIGFGTGWSPGDFAGIIIANSLGPLDPVPATVKDINANPTSYAFKRVTIPGSYVVTTATIDYSDIKAPMGQGILADSFSGFFEEDPKATLETIDPNRTVWQLRENSVTGTVVYPTEQVLKYLDYSAPLSKAQMAETLKPCLIVDTLADDVVSIADISQINPVTGNPSKYWGKVVEFEGYALGINYPLKSVAKAVAQTEIPVNVNLLAVGIAGKPAVGSQLAIIGLNNELTGANGDVIMGRFKFRVAVTQVPQELASGVPYGGTAFFLLSKQELPMTLSPTTAPPTTLPTTNPSLNIPAGLVTPAQGAIGVAIDATFTWPSVYGATGYEFVIAEDFGNADKFATIDYSATTQTNTHKLRENLKYNTTYYWRVRAFNMTTKGSWMVSFFTTKPVSPPKIGP